MSDIEAPVAKPGTRSRLRDPRVWFALVVTVFAVWLTLRGVDLETLAGEFRRAHWGVLLALSIPAHVGGVWLRALRWGHLTDSIQTIPRALLFRATAIGFMGNNLFPLRLGELLRVWALSRDSGAAPAAVLGSVVLERVIDTLCVLGMAVGVILVWGGPSEAWGRTVVGLAPIALLPLLALGALRAAPDRTLGLLEWLLRPAPRRPADWLLTQLRGFAAGLGGLRGGVHLVWIAVHSVGIWVVAAPLPILAACWALGVDFGSLVRTLAAGWSTIAALGIAVALPSAPGFFGLYHSACRLVLEQFGVPAETAVAIGTLAHAVFWLTLTPLGVVLLRRTHTGIAESLERAAR